MDRNRSFTSLLAGLAVLAAGCAGAEESGGADKPTPSWELTGSLSRANLSLGEETLLHLSLRSLVNETGRSYAVEVKAPPEMALQGDPWWNGTAEPGQASEATFVMRAQGEGCGRVLAVGPSFVVEVPFCVGKERSASASPESASLP